MPKIVEELDVPETSSAETFDYVAFLAGLRHNRLYRVECDAGTSTRAAHRRINKAAETLKLNVRWHKSQENETTVAFSLHPLVEKAA